MQNETPIVVLKFGSSVLQSETDLPTAVHEIYSWWREGHQVVAVVSAFGNTTDELAQRAQSVCDQPGDELVAALLATGEAASSLDGAGAESIRHSSNCARCGTSLASLLMAQHSTPT